MKEISSVEVIKRLLDAIEQIGTDVKVVSVCIDCENSCFGDIVDVEYNADAGHITLIAKPF